MVVVSLALSMSFNVPAISFNISAEVSLVPATASFTLVFSFGVSKCLEILLTFFEMSVSVPHILSHF